METPRSISAGRSRRMSTAAHLALLQRGAHVRLTVAPAPRPDLGAGNNAAPPADSNTDIAAAFPTMSEGNVFIVDMATQSVVIESFNAARRKHGYNIVSLSSIRFCS